MGAINDEVLEKVKSLGYQSVLNIRRPAEAGYLPEEGDLAAAKGLKYASSPVEASADGINMETVKAAVETLLTLPKPTFVHCASGARASLVVLVSKHLHGQPTDFDTMVSTALGLGYVYNDNWKKNIKEALFQ